MDKQRQARDEDTHTRVVHDDVIARLITRALGEELKRTREDTGLSQAQLVARMPSNVRVKTLASYEQGARPCTVVRLCEITRALGASPIDILARALHRTELDAQTIRLHVDLHALTHDPRPEFKPLRRWARARLATHPQNTLARLDGNTIQEMAVLLENHTHRLDRPASDVRAEHRVKQGPTELLTPQEPADYLAQFTPTASPSCDQRAPPNPQPS